MRSKNHLQRRTYMGHDKTIFIKLKLYLLLSLKKFIIVCKKHFVTFFTFLFCSETSVKILHSTDEYYL